LYRRHHHQQQLNTQQQKELELLEWHYLMPHLLGYCRKYYLQKQ
jgi:hypothetical protein